ncbi:MAG: hypothetical protein V4726_00990 [Verrucomicrobiota bacterium]
MSDQPRPKAPTDHLLPTINGILEFADHYADPETVRQLLWDVACSAVERMRPADCGDLFSIGNLALSRMHTPVNKPAAATTESHQ